MEWRTGVAVTPAKSRETVRIEQFHFLIDSLRIDSSSSIASESASALSQRKCGSHPIEHVFCTKRRLGPGAP